VPGIHRYDGTSETDPPRSVRGEGEDRQRVVTERVRTPNRVDPQCFRVFEALQGGTQRRLLLDSQANPHERDSTTFDRDLSNGGSRMEKRARSRALLTEVLMLIAQVRPAVEALASELAEPSGLTFAGWHIASALGAGEATVPELAARLGRRRQSIQVAVDEMVRSGHAAKVANPQHARSWKFVLTSNGRSAFWDTTSRHATWVNEEAKNYDRDDLAATLRVLRSLSSRLDTSSR
jgi:DNA-binding MarR family transcriptional regulator